MRIGDRRHFNNGTSQRRRAAECRLRHQKHCCNRQEYALRGRRYCATLMRHSAKQALGDKPETMAKDGLHIVARGHYPRMCHDKTNAAGSVKMVHIGLAVWIDL